MEKYILPWPPEARENFGMRNAECEMRNERSLPLEEFRIRHSAFRILAGVCSWGLFLDKENMRPLSFSKLFAGGGARLPIPRE